MLDMQSAFAMDAVPGTSWNQDRNDVWADTAAAAKVMNRVLLSMQFWMVDSSDNLDGAVFSFRYHHPDPDQPDVTVYYRPTNESPDVTYEVVYRHGEDELWQHYGVGGGFHAEKIDTNLYRLFCQDNHPNSEIKVRPSLGT